MQCPIDQTQLVVTERQGVEIDYCPTCRGVWLDRGELDKIIARANEFEAGMDRDESTSRRDFDTPRVGDMQGRVRRLDSDRRDYDDDDDDYEVDRDGRRRRKGRRRSFFDDLFDFD
jgi:Zn-finger nucleic acid-binding protein